MTITERIRDDFETCYEYLFGVRVGILFVVGNMSCTNEVLCYFMALSSMKYVLYDFISEQEKICGSPEITCLSFFMLLGICCQLEKKKIQSRYFLLI